MTILSETATLFEGEILPGDMIVRLRDAYCDKLLVNPPTPAFMETNPKREAAARFAARRDIDRLLAVLDDLGLTIGPKTMGTEKAVPE